MSAKHQELGYLLAFGSAAAGALRYNLAVWAKVEYGFDYVSFLAYALLVGVVASGIHVLRTSGWKGFLPLKGHLHHALLYGVLMGWSTLAHFLALESLNETLMTSLGQTGILVSLGLAAWLLHERLTRQEWVATIVILAGVFMFRPWQAGNRTGFLILLSGVICGSLASVGAKRWVQGTSPQVLMVWRNLVAFVLVLGAALAMGKSKPEFQTPTVVACILTGLLGPYLHGLFFLQALQYISASRASLMGRVQPVIVFVVSYLALDRIPEREQMASALVLTIGTFWLIRSRPTKRA
ncbi:MAG: DMT family transporter [Planctomycetota bacterium]